MVTFRMVLLGAAAAATLVLGVVMAETASQPPGRDKIDKLFADGNFKDAFEGYRRLALEPKTEPDLVGSDLRHAVDCLARLGRTDEIDDLREAVVAVHSGNWRLLEAAALSYLLDDQHQGQIVAGKFHRGRQRRGGRFVSCFERDRVRAIQLLMQGIDRARSDADRRAAGHYLVTLAQSLMADRASHESWRLQSLTSLEALPDYDENAYRYWNTSSVAAPVELDGSPVYYSLPESFQKARNDGQRWRWALAQAVEIDASLLNTIRRSLAEFLLSQFGTQTIAGSQFGPVSAESGPEASGPFALDTLKDDETIARLATGIKRFKLPDEFNPIKIYQAIADDPKTGEGELAFGALASIFENRRQFDRAALYLKRSKDTYGDPGDAKQKRIDQIKGAWGQFDALRTLPAGKGATVDFRFRNGKQVHLEAHEIRYDKLLKDVKDYITSGPKQLNWQKLEIQDVGQRLITDDGEQYLGRSIARWDVDLEPLPGHFDKRITITTPLQTAGAYLLTAKMEGGNTSRIIVWLDDTVILKKLLESETYYFVADARTGAAIAQADVAFFGWRTVQVPGKNDFRIETKRFAHKTDAEGQLKVKTADLVDQQGNYQWLITASNPEGRLAHLGFTNIWSYGNYDSIYDQVQVYTITDRPVYRPGAPVRFKFWVARSRYDQPDAADFAGQTFDAEIYDPKSEKIFTKKFTADKFGGFDGTFELPSDAALGVYHVQVPERGGGSFRVEEYKKPEFEVTVEAPARPVALGEKVTATIKANYYFGAPGRRGKGQVQDHPLDGRRALVSHRKMGLALRPGILVVRRRFLVVPRMVALGHVSPGGMVVGSPSGAA